MTRDDPLVRPREFPFEQLNINKVPIRDHIFHPFLERISYNTPVDIMAFAGGIDLHV